MCSPRDVDHVIIPLRTAVVGHSHELVALGVQVHDCPVRLLAGALAVVAVAAGIDGGLCVAGHPIVSGRGADVNEEGVHLIGDHRVRTPHSIPDSFGSERSIGDGDGISGLEPVGVGGELDARGAHTLCCADRHSAPGVHALAEDALVAEAFVPDTRNPRTVLSPGAGVGGCEVVAPTAPAVAFGAQSHRRPISLGGRLCSGQALQLSCAQLPVPAVLLHLQAIRRVGEPRGVAVGIHADAADHVHTVPLQLARGLHVIGRPHSGLRPCAHSAGPHERPRQVLQSVPSLPGCVRPRHFQRAHRGLPRHLRFRRHRNRAAAGAAQGERVGSGFVDVEHHAVELRGGLHAVEDHGVVHGEAVGGDGDGDRGDAGVDTRHGLRVVGGVRHTGGGVSLHVSTSRHHNHPHTVVLGRVHGLLHGNISLLHLRLRHQIRHPRASRGREIVRHRRDDTVEGLEAHLLVASLC
mmetsp:Transcript_42570/g.102619  ORF Transcript_42570/g.102619 Transcript_42570/m.102619 type:complete len:465 (+) Transcript_42570:3057-4451(+)